MWRAGGATTRTNIPITCSLLHEWEAVTSIKKKTESRRRAVTEIRQRIYPSFLSSHYRISFQDKMRRSAKRQYS
jgi:hypothetical protein